MCWFGLHRYRHSCCRLHHRSGPVHQFRMPAVPSRRVSLIPPLSRLTKPACRYPYRHQNLSLLDPDGGDACDWRPLATQTRRILPRRNRNRDHGSVHPRARLHRGLQQNSRPTSSLPRNQLFANHVPRFGRQNREPDGYHLSGAFEPVAQRPCRERHYWELRWKQALRQRECCQMQLYRSQTTPEPVKAGSVTSPASEPWNPADRPLNRSSDPA